MTKRDPLMLDLSSSRPLRIVGVHDALSALVAVSAGCDALWASSFCVSAACFGMPDAGLITLTEMLETVKRIRSVTPLPIIVDADTGYGGVLNVLRATRESLAGGVAALCIEDAEFPKRNSFIEKKHRRLA